MPEENVTVTENAETAVVTTPVVAVTETAADIAKIESAIAGLKAGGEDLFAHQIEDLKAKRDELLAEAEEAAKQAVTMVETEEQSLYQQYKGKAWETVKAGALAAIVYKLFFF